MGINNKLAVENSVCVTVLTELYINCYCTVCVQSSCTVELDQYHVAVMIHI